MNRPNEYNYTFSHASYTNDLETYCDYLTELLKNKNIKRQWIELTDDDYLHVLDSHPYEGTDREFWKALEKKLKEKNT